MTMGIILPQGTRHGSGGDFYDQRLLNDLRQHGEDIHIFTIPIKPQRYSHHELLQAIQQAHCTQILEDGLCFRTLALLNQKLRHDPRHPQITAILHTLQAYLEQPGQPQQTALTQERQFFQTIDSAIWVSNQTQTETRQILGSTLPGIVAYPGKDHIRPQGKKPRHSENLRILYVGTIINYKGLDTLVNALTVMDCSSWELLVVGVPRGDPQYLRRIQKTLADSLCASQVIFAGYLPHIVLPKIYAAHDILVGPSWYEGFGLVYVEALGAGLPVIATANGGPCDYLADGADSFLLTPGDSERLSSLLDLLAASPEHLTTMSAHAKTTYARLPTWNVTLERIRTYLQSHALS